MKQIIQSLKTGETSLENIPMPKVSTNNILIKTTRSLVSLGTERMLVEFGKSSLLQKARQQPDKVMQVIAKIKSDGLLQTIEAVTSKLEQPIPLGYSNVGRVVAIGQNVHDFQIGDRVVSNGPHAEYVSVSKNLAALIPDNVSDDEASFTVISSIALQGLRLCNPTFGETVVVIGLGLIGLITAELLISNGCEVIGIDIDEQKIVKARSKGVKCINANRQNSVRSVADYTKGLGADAVIITASNKSDQIISESAQMSRKRGRIILVGVVGLDIKRSDFYEKELSFQVSCSYGPGRYDDNYEVKGEDYPLAYVRWTEKRNFEAILQALSSGKIEVKSLISEIIPLEDYKAIYDSIDSNSGKIASIIEYSDRENPAVSVVVTPTNFQKEKGVFGIIGAGNFTKMTMLPALKRASANIKYLSSANGISSTMLAKKFRINISTTTNQQIFDDPEVDTVIISTRHNSHASFVVEALKANKNVFVEKPLALSESELKTILTAYTGMNSITVGFNRRFSPHTQKVKKYLDGSPINVVATMNAGSIPSGSWVHDLTIGGGRIIGEACHFVDLITYLSGSMVKEVCMNALGVHPQENSDNATILLKYENGSSGVINYFSNGSKQYSKERIEVYSQERTIVIDNFRSTEAFGVKGFSKFRTKQDKGHDAQFSLLKSALTSTGKPLIPFDEIINTTKATFAAIESLKMKGWISIV